MNTISGIYKITNTITGDFYIGSSKNVKRRLAAHQWPSKWKQCPNNPLYKDMQKYGVDKFSFEILEEAEPDKLKEKEQQFIETLKPTYNNRSANGWNVERRKEYEKTDKRKEYKKEYQKEYQNQLCCYNGETITLNALRHRFTKAGIDHPTTEAKKYLIER